ncbi:hypothetical protein BX616_002226 [Lobosporangium transversale]|uniref:Uncharacterized protein n=1 Tax=Lobosporangium transversale TaxID=64571 RepID=A0A1Y2GUX9_9FUNG|nr:hypothetical protein BCR41DRAFT_421410 [Lobosporangium transversale]KAF9901537.1 hypothetical protein BX616_002226 [Lobosporangium transversale]ORZ19231.1 hypothetical protein BCR41DRAFT_421410 [Lobosporangium transversale]|eukprot:XP_021882399.1 hypothetical protein BCR41DRAFT_421410 [Lobosporangium transversale]
MRHTDRRSIWSMRDVNSTLTILLHQQQQQQQSALSINYSPFKTFKNYYTMPLFKSNKNKSASAATTPAQTPRTSIHEERPMTTKAGTNAHKMTRDQALEVIMKTSMGNAANTAFAQ